MLEKLTQSVEIIRALGDNPNIDDGLSSEELKMKFDEAARIIKSYLNGIMVPYINELSESVSKQLDPTLTRPDLAAQAQAVGLALKKVLPLNGSTAMTGNLPMGGNKVTGLAAPTENTDAVNKAYADTAVRKAAPRNLLDNSDFRNPVNQRGVTFSNTNNTYTIDRWFIGDIWDAGQCSFSQYNGNIAFAQGLFQRIAIAKSEIAGKTYTLALKTTDGTICAFPIVLPENIVSGESYAVKSDNVAGVLRYFDGIGLEVRFESRSAISCLWAALYEGEYTAEILPEYRPKGYGAELLECQRYYCKFDKSNDPCWLIAVNSSFAVGAINFPVEMRTTPTLTDLQCIDLSSGTVEVSNPVCSTKGISYVSGGFTVGSGYRILFEASADL